MGVNMTISAQDKVANSRATLLRKQPFFGFFCFKLKWVVNNNIPTACTDGTTIFYNEKFFDGMTKVECNAVALHEIFHVVLKHPFEMKRFFQNNPQWDKPKYYELANVAMDYVINPMIDDLKKKWFQLPKDCLFDINYKGKHWVEVFKQLVKQDQEQDQEDNQDGGQSGDQSGDDQSQDQSNGDAPDKGKPSDSKTGGMGGVVTPKDEDGNELSKVASDEIEKELDVQIEHARSVAKARGELPSHLADIAENNKKPRIDWKAVLNKFVAPLHASYLSYTRFNKRQLAQGNKLPHAKKDGVGEIAFGIDTSASTDLETEVRQFMAEGQKVIDKIKPEKVTIYWFTERVWQVDTIRRGQKFTMPKNVRRGGTSFQSVFDAVNKARQKPKALIMLTDMECPFPKKPRYPVLWVSTQADKVAPYGKTTYLNVNLDEVA